MCKQILSPMNEYYYMILSFIKLSCRDLKFIYNIWNMKNMTLLLEKNVFYNEFIL